MEKRLLIISIIILLVFLIALGGFIYYQKESPESKTIREFKDCHASFDLNKLDFTKPIWDSELSIILPQLIAMQAFVQKDEGKCDYFKNLEQVNPNLTVENCQRIYRFLDSTEKLQKGMDCQSYIEECKNFINLEDVPEELLEKVNNDFCGSLCQSFKNKTPIITDPNTVCENELSPQISDTVDYLDVKTNQTKTCFTGIGGDIKFLVAVANYVSTSCSTINNSLTRPLCQFYFERDANFRKYRTEFEQEYCGLFVGKVISPTQ